MALPAAWSETFRTASHPGQRTLIGMVGLLQTQIRNVNALAAAD
jgi:hypothetical protein